MANNEKTNGQKQAHSKTTTDNIAKNESSNQPQRRILDREYFYGIFKHSHKGVVVNYIMDNQPIDALFERLNELHDHLVTNSVQGDIAEAETEQRLFNIGVLVSVAISINNGDISNLSDIHWGSVTNQWSIDGLEEFLRSINVVPMRAAILDCMIEQYKLYRIKDYPTELIHLNQEYDFIEYCNILKTHMQHYEAYNVETITRGYNERISNIEQRLTELEKKSDGKRHFGSKLDNKTLTEIFKDLTDNQYLAADSGLNAWLWVCTGKGEKPTAVPLKWCKPATDIAVMVQLVFGSNRGDERWETAAACFLVQGKNKEWKAPDTQYLAKRVSGRKGNLGQLRVTQIGKLLVPHLTK